MPTRTRKSKTSKNASIPPQNVPTEEDAFLEIENLLQSLGKTVSSPHQNADHQNQVEGDELCVLSPQPERSQMHKTSSIILPRIAEREDTAIELQWQKALGGVAVSPRKKPKSIRRPMHEPAKRTKREAVTFADQPRLKERRARKTKGVIPVQDLDTRTFNAEDEQDFALENDVPTVDRSYSNDSETTAFLLQMKKLTEEKKKAQQRKVIQGNTKTLAAAENLAGKSFQKSKEVVGGVSSTIMAQFTNLNRVVDDVCAGVRDAKSEIKQEKERQMQQSKLLLSESKSTLERLRLLTDRFKKKRLASLDKAKKAIAAEVRRSIQQTEARERADQTLFKLKQVLLERNKFD